MGRPLRGVVDSCALQLQGTVSAIEPDVDAATRMVWLQAVVPNADGRLRPGMAARVRLEVGTIADALLVQQEAVVRQGTRTLVWVVTADGTAVARDVRLGVLLADRVQLRAGVTTGDVVVNHRAPEAAPGRARRRDAARAGREPRCASSPPPRPRR